MWKIVFLKKWLLASFLFKVFLSRMMPFEHFHWIRTKTIKRLVTYVRVHLTMELCHHRNENLCRTSHVSAPSGYILELRSYTQLHVAISKFDNGYDEGYQFAEFYTCSFNYNIISSWWRLIPFSTWPSTWPQVTNNMISVK
jgi:hypothetical protein